MHEGRVLANRFQLGGVVGAGGGGTVHRARDRASDTVVAVKLVNLDAAGGAVRDRFQREATLLATLRDPGIVRHIDHGIVDDVGYLVMQWVEGPTLKELLQRTRPTTTQALDLVGRIAAALATVHRAHVVHRDVKPANVVLEEGALDRPVLVDFGIARLQSDPSAATVTTTGAILGTPGYMAPEQARGQRDIDERADVFALGCLLYRCVTGVVPFAGDDPIAVLASTCLETPRPVDELVPELPPGLPALLDAMLAKERELRPPDAAAVAAELALVTEGRPPARRGAAARQPRGIGYETQRFACLVVARARAGAHATDAPAPPSGRPTVLDADTATARSLAAHYAGQLVRLVDGTYAAAFTSSGYSADLAHRARSFARAFVDEHRGFAAFVAAGSAVVGDRSVAGSATERAMRGLEAAAPDEVVVDEATARLLEGREPSTTTDAVRVVSSVGHGGASEAAPFVGRDRDLAFLVALFDECRSESVARAALVVGEAGAGKSALRRELARAVRARNVAARLLVGQGDEFRRSALALLVGALSDPAEASDAPDAADRTRALLRVLAGLEDPPDASRASMAAALARSEASAATRRAFVDWLEEELRRGPVVLLLDDIHWADSASLELVGRALSALAAAPLLVVGFGRPEGTSTGAFASRGSSALQTLQLMPLTRGAAERIVAATAPADVSPEDVASIVARGGGNPFHLRELALAMHERNFRSLPPSVLGMLQVGIDALDADAARVLRAASVFGRTFARDGVAAASGLDAASPLLAGWLADLETRAMIVAAGRATFTFRHDLVRAAAYAMLTDEDRRVGHRLAAEWLERAATGAPSDADPLAIAEHFERACETIRASAWFLRAAERALRSGEAGSALALVDRVTDGGSAARDTVIHRELLRAAALRSVGRFAEALGAARAAMAEAHAGPTLWYALAEELTINLLWCDEVDEATSWIERLATARASEAAEPSRRRALLHLLVHLARAGRADAARRCFAVAEIDLDDHAALDPRAVGDAHSLKALFARIGGDVAAAIDASRRAVGAYTTAQQVHTACFAKLALAQQLAQVGASDDALTLVQEVTAEARRLGFVLVGVAATLAACEVLLEKGAFAEVAAIAAADQAAAETVPARRHRTSLTCERAVAAAHLGAWDVAEPLARSLLAGPGPSRVRRAAAFVLAWALAERGEALAAAAQVEAAARMSVDPFRPDRVWEALVRVRVLDALRRPDESRVLLQEEVNALAVTVRRLAGTSYARSVTEGVPAHAELLRVARERGVVPRAGSF